MDKYIKTLLVFCGRILVSASSKYGEKAKDGVIVITTKKKIMK